MKNNNRRKKSIIFSTMLIITAITLITTTIISAYWSTPSAGFSNFVVDEKTSFSQPEFNVDSNIDNRFDGDLFNIAFLGFDKSSSEQSHFLPRPDTIVIAAIDFKSNKVSLVSIPRDSYVKIYGTEIFDKINHSYMYGYQSADINEDPHKKGIEVVLLTIEEFLSGVPINGYITTDMDGVVAITDSIGGVDFDVEQEVRSDFGQGRILVEKGQQNLDGKLLLQYVKNRAFQQGGDHGRNERQQKILIALFKKLKEKGVFKNLLSHYESLNAHVDTNLKTEQIAALGFLGLRLNPDKIETYVFNGSGKLSDYNGKQIYFLYVDEDGKNSIIEKVFLY